MDLINGVSWEVCGPRVTPRSQRVSFLNPEVWPDLALYVARSRIYLSPSYSMFFLPSSSKMHLQTSEQSRSLALSLGSGILAPGRELTSSRLLPNLSAKNYLDEPRRKLVVVSPKNGMPSPSPLLMRFGIFLIGTCDVGKQWEKSFCFSDFSVLDSLVFVCMSVSSFSQPDATFVDSVLLNTFLIMFKLSLFTKMRLQ